MTSETLFRGVIISAGILMIYIWMPMAQTDTDTRQVPVNDSCEVWWACQSGDCPDIRPEITYEWARSTLDDYLRLSQLSNLTVLSPELPVSGRVHGAEDANLLFEAEAGQPLSFVLTGNPDRLFTEIESVSGEAVAALATRFDGTDLTQVILPARSGRYVLRVTGQGAYTIRLVADDLLTVERDTLQPGQFIDDVKEAGRPLRYPVAMMTGQDEQSGYVTLTFRDRGAVIFPMLYADGQRILKPVFERREADRLQQVYAVSPCSQPVLVITGSGQYRIEVSAGDTLREFRGVVQPGQILDESFSQTGAVRYQLNTEYATVTVQVSGRDKSLLVRDGAGVILYPETVFEDRETGNTASVYELTGLVPYSLTVISETDYRLSVEAGNTGLTDPVIIRDVDVRSLFMPDGQTALYDLVAEPGQALTATLIYSPDVRLADFEFEIRDSRGQLIPPERIVVRGVDRIQVEFILTGEAPYRLVPRLYGSHILSIARSDLSLQSLDVILPEDRSVNLRAGPGGDFDVIGTGEPGSTIQAVARNPEGDWLLGVTEERVAVWVARTLVETDLNLDSLPVRWRNFADTQGVTQGTGTPCTVQSEGGVNLRGGPGLEYDVVRTFAPDERITVTGQAVDGEGFTWWQLADGAWVRFDVVTVSGACEAVPVLNPG